MDWKRVTHNTMKTTALVALRLAKMVLRLARAELAEVFSRLGHDVCEEFHFYAAERLAAEGNVKEDDWVRGCWGCHGCGGELYLGGQIRDAELKVDGDGEKAGGDFGLVFAGSDCVRIGRAVEFVVT